jgi:hypothetical protein
MRAGNRADRPLTSGAGFRPRAPSFARAPPAHVAVLRTLPAHRIVQLTYPRPPPTETDDIALAEGKAIDGVLSEMGYALRLGRRPTATAMLGRGEELLDEALAEGPVEMPAAERERFRERLRGTFRAYRASPIAGLPRPKTRLVVIGDEVGVYVQPDYWDGRARVFEMKSYRAIPPKEDVALQLRLFQLAYPGFELVLVCLDRHATPVALSSASIPPMSADERAATIRLAYDLGRVHGEEKVREYLEGPFVPYPRPSAAAGAGGAG